MSGGGGSDFSFPGSGGSDEKPCGALNFEATLQSPDPVVVTTVTVGQTLDVEVDGHVAAALAPAGRAGTILNNLTRLLQCLHNGYIFKADVLLVSGGVIKVHVRPE